MSTSPAVTPNIKQAVPFFRVADMQRSTHFYIDGLGFTMKNEWVVEGKRLWCWLERGTAALMLQEYLKEGPHSLANQQLGTGVSICFQCEDALALYHEFKSRNLNPNEPFVGNSMWVTILSDPDGYKLDFESPTTVPEETKLSNLPR